MLREQKQRVTASVLKEAKRQQAYKFGKFSEWLALIFLTLKGYRILSKSWRHHMGEIDIIAMHRDTLVFVEVKARKGRAVEEVLSHHQQQRIMHAAEWFMISNPHLSSYFMRFDLIIIRPYRWPVHIMQAWGMK